jgi:hypothetical protein
MSTDTDRIEELEQSVHDLMKEVDRDRTATESLGSNRSYIRKHILHREERAMPASSANDARKAQS